MAPEFSIWIDRSTNTIESLVTLQQFEGGKVKKLFDRLKCRTGERGHTHTSWTRGKSGIPFSNQVEGGDLFLMLQPSPLQMSPGGRFFPFCSDPSRPRIIRSEDGLNERVDIGLHKENEYPGSAGCVAVIKWSEFDAMADKLEWIRRTYGLKYIEAHVI